MREIIIGKIEEGQRFDKYLKKYLNSAGSGFIYKMLRKKNITLNGKKASGNEIICEGDTVRMFMSDETIDKFSGDNNIALPYEIETHNGMKSIVTSEFVIPILYEDNDEIFFNKPAGLLSQKADKNDISLADIFAGYMRDRCADDNPGYRPGICNRLDRNTSGIVAAGKSVTGLRKLSGQIRDRSVKKFYRCIVEGKVTEGGHLKGYLFKNKDNNKVNIITENPPGDAELIETIYTPLEVNESFSYLEVELITGKSHQIRAHLSSIGHPIVGDRKYALNDGSKGGQHNQREKNSITADRQMLHAYEMKFEDKTIFAPLPEDFERVYRYAILEFKRS